MDIRLLSSLQYTSYMAHPNNLTSYYYLLHFEWADQRKHCANICHMAQVKW